MVGKKKKKKKGFFGYSFCFFFTGILSSKCENPLGDMLCELDVTVFTGNNW